MVFLVVYILAPVLTFDARFQSAFAALESRHACLQLTRLDIAMQA